MNEPVVKYEWSWACLSLFRNFSDGKGIGGSSRIFTLKPAWLWQYWHNKFMVAIGKWPPDSFDICYHWLRKNGNWNLEGKEFLAAITRFENYCQPGTLLKLNPRLLK